MVPWLEGALRGREGPVEESGDDDDDEEDEKDGDEFESCRVACLPALRLPLLFYVRTA